VSVEHTVINEGDYKAGLQPSDTFARFVREIGSEAGLGSLALGAIQELVDERTTVPETAYLATPPV
jgi:hypothetical protein